ncbi:sialidase family protein [Niabella insulamsoli]|uniref:sialidase family protein n=1 Tax=Niabella insulamsoli TaxID=3144874 RepID=UPI0031FD8923
MGILLLALSGFVLAAQSSFSHVQKVDRPGGKTIQWDKNTLNRVAAPVAGSNYAGYARLIELDNGNLLCVYESGGAIWQTISVDKGASWQKAKEVAAREEGINMAVPDLLALKNGTLLLMYNPRPYIEAPSRHFAIRVKTSLDDGVTWSEAREIYKAGHAFKNGCWEPSAIQLPDGTIQLFFANEGIYLHSDEQNISMLSSQDNGCSWSRHPKIISFRKGKRDGMPVPLLLKNEPRIVVAIEDNGFANFKPYTISNTFRQGWKEPVDAASKDRKYALKDSLNENVYAGAPYIKQLSTGETILSYQGTEGRPAHVLQQAVMKVAVGNERAQDFEGVTEPFQIPLDKNGLWNSIAVLGDDTIVALTSTNAYSKGSVEVWMIKGKLGSQE